MQGAQRRVLVVSRKSTWVDQLDWIVNWWVPLPPVALCFFFAKVLMSLMLAIKADLILRTGSYFLDKNLRLFMIAAFWFTSSKQTSYIWGKKNISSCIALRIRLFFLVYNAFMINFSSIIRYWLWVRLQLEPVCTDIFWFYKNWPTMRMKIHQSQVWKQARWLAIHAGMEVTFATIFWFYKFTRFSSRYFVVIRFCSIASINSSLAMCSLCEM